MRILDAALAVLAAFLFQSVLGRYLPALDGYVDLFAVISAGFGLVHGRMFGMLTGIAAGLVQDVFSGGHLGINGISKTTVGYVAGIAGHHLIIRGWSSRVLFFLLASGLDLVILAALGAAIEEPRVLGEGLRPIYLCIGNIIAGMILIRVIDRPERGELA
ncbi:MAG TPA: hypothetical protein VLK65_25285 [Vicinamibacteria bacterium]|nr:hypothetical protein [Vicinamibacteria bacterium]